MINSHGKLKIPGYLWETGFDVSQPHRRLKKQQVIST